MASTPYAVSVGQGSLSYGGFVRAPIVGPLSTRQTPGTLPYHAYGTLAGVRPTPPQFYPGQEPVAADMHANARAMYRRSQATPFDPAFADPVPKHLYNVSSSLRKVPVSTRVNYVAPVDSSAHLARRKSQAVGKSAYKTGLPALAPVSTKAVSTSYTHSSLRRVRSGGCVAPRKKGALENPFSARG